MHGAHNVLSVLTKHCLVCTACIQYSALLDGRRLRGRGRIPDGQDLVGKHSSASRSMLLMLVDWAVTFPKVREGVFSINSQIVLAKSFLSKRFLGIPMFFKVNSPVHLKRVWFGPLKSFSFLADMI